MMKLLYILFFIFLLHLLSGCAPAVVGGAAGATVARDSRDTNTYFDDQLLTAKIKDAIYKNPDEAKRIHINVTTFNGVVLLTGEALSKSSRQRAIDIARHVEHVRRVHNEVRIADLTGFQSRASDSWITSKIKAKMIGTSGFDSSLVTVTTENGTVFLMGLVTREEGHKAAEIARRVDGVKRVVKLFEYVAPTTATSAP
jgi:osmotically-inducible protein OsmY